MKSTVGVNKARKCNKDEIYDRELLREALKYQELKQFHLPIRPNHLRLLLTEDDRMAYFRKLEMRRFKRASVQAFEQILLEVGPNDRLKRSNLIKTNKPLVSTVPYKEDMKEFGDSIFKTMKKIFYGCKEINKPLKNRISVLEKKIMARLDSMDFMKCHKKVVNFRFGQALTNAFITAEVSCNGSNPESDVIIEKIFKNRYVYVIATILLMI